MDYRPNYKTRRGAHVCPAGRAFTLVELVVVVAILAALAGLVVPLLNTETDTALTTARTTTLNAIRDAMNGMVADTKYGFTPTFTYTDLHVGDLLSSARFPAALQTWKPNSRTGWHGAYIQGGLPVLNSRAERASLYPAATDKQTSAASDTKTYTDRKFYVGSTSRYGADGELAIGDEWGCPIVLQVPAVGSSFVNSSGATITLDTAEKCWHYARLVSAGPDGILDTLPDDPLAGRITGNALDSSKRGADDVILFLNRVDAYE